MLAYWREALFAATATCNWSSCYALLGNTVRFHLHNWRGKNSGASEIFTVELRLGDGKTVAIKLRSLSGDIFILQAKIYSVEPLPDNFALLEANVKHEPRITPLYGCLTGNSQHTVQFTTDHPTWGNRIGDSGITVPALTIDELCRKEGINCIDLLKLDIEGGEEQILANGNFLERVRHIIIELHNDYDFRRFQQDGLLDSRHIRPTRQTHAW